MSNKILILLRGLPGAGKSTVAKELVKLSYVPYEECYYYAEAFETDNYFINDKGEYKFDASKIKEAHEWNKQQVENSMKSGQEYVIVSNTFTTEKELEPYLLLAKQYDYNVVSLVVENRHGNKNVHGVPDETLTKMKNRFNLKLI